MTYHYHVVEFINEEIKGLKVTGVIPDKWLLPCENGQDRCHEPGSGTQNFLKPVGLSVRSRFLSQQVCIYFFNQYSSIEHIYIIIKMLKFSVQFCCPYRFINVFKTK